MFLFDNGAEVDASVVDVHDMKFIGTVLDIDGSGTSVTIDDLVVENNDLSTLESHTWTGADIDGGAQMVLTNLRFCDNRNVENVLSSSSASSVSVESAKICGSVAVSQEDVKAYVFISSLVTGCVNSRWGRSTFSQ